MRSIEEIIEHSKRFEFFEDYCHYFGIENPTIDDEKDFFRRFDIHNYTSLNIFHQIYYEDFLTERLSTSLSPDFVMYQLKEQIGEYLESSPESISLVRKENVTIQFFVQHKYIHNSNFRTKLDNILHFCNWSIFWDGPSKRIHRNKFKIEPSKPQNATSFIYDKCDGIIYRLLYYRGGHTKKKTEDILKKGLSPKYYEGERENLISNNRIYFIANTTEEKVRKDLKELITKDETYANHIDELQFIKIDLKKFNRIHNKKIEAFIDPRMELTCYWTLEFIPPSCISNVTNKFLTKL